MGRQKNQRGFTLLEVLISLVLLGLLFVALGQGLRFGLGAWELQDKASRRSESLEATDRTLRLLIEGMEPDGDGTHQALSGRRDQMSFIGSLPSAAAIGRRAEMTLSLTNHGQLVLRWRPHRHEKGAPPPEADALLLEGVEHVDFAYWRPAASGLKGGWIDEWLRPGLPGLVRIHLQFGKNDPRHWPDIVIAPMLEARGGV
ncbi:MAG TPA: prepilin-type N-terminal cleavage/methylation domain-containing protein [Telmatospirillum sp.]|nr:prepilin-type N-terminal cleavage/methylation domain-containing protein [Telmatospirillum sp.]